LILWKVSERGGGGSVKTLRYKYGVLKEPSDVAMGFISNPIDPYRYLPIGERKETPL